MAHNININGYTIYLDQELGEGGNAVVYAATNPNKPHLLAAKRLRQPDQYNVLETHINQLIGDSQYICRLYE